MDPSIVKLLEDDEDDTMHSGADVEAFQAALNRDIGGDATTTQPSESDAVSQGRHNISGHLPHIQASQHENANSQMKQEQYSSPMDLDQHASISVHQQQHDNSNLQAPQRQPQDDQQRGQVEQVPTQIPQTTGLSVSERKPFLKNEPDRMHNRDTESQYVKLQKMSNQQAMVSEQATNQVNRGKQVPFALLLPVLLPQLDKDRAMQLQTIFNKLKKNEMTKDDFVRMMRGVVGDHMLRMAVTKVQSQSPPSVRQVPPRMPPVSAGPTNFVDPRSFAQLHQKGLNSPAVPSHIPSSSAQGLTDSSYPAMENNAQFSREAERASSGPIGMKQEREHPSIPVQGLDHHQGQLHFQQNPLTMYGNNGNNYQPYPGTAINTSTSSLKQQPSHESQMRHQSIGSSAQLVGNMPGMDMMSSSNFNDPKRVQSGSVSQFSNNLQQNSVPQFSNNLTSQQNSVPWQSAASKEQNSGPFSSMAYVKQDRTDQASEQQKNQTSRGSSSISDLQAEQGNATSGTLKDDSLEKQSLRGGFPSAMPSTSANTVPSSSVSQNDTAQLDSNVMLGARNPSLTVTSAINNRTPPKKPLIGQKKPLETVGGSPSLSSKKQKVSGAFQDQSIEQLNDVTAVSGVNIREEEEHLFSGAKEDSRVSEASRKVVQEEEERLILQKTPLQKKLAEIMAKCGLKTISNDVERCLSLCVEERMRGLISNLVRLSKQRVDAEKPRHRTVLTSDVRQQIMIMNRKAREEWEKKQADVEKLQKINEPEDINGASGDKEKDESRTKSVKGHANKEEDDKMRTTAANVAARAAVGGDDMLSKWQLMAEQARQKREGGNDLPSGSQSGKDVPRKTLSASGRNAKDNQETEKKGNGAPAAQSGAMRKFGRNQVTVPQQVRVARNITVKDVIAVLEREPQMSKSSVIYRLYEKIHSDATTEQ